MSEARNLPSSHCQCREPCTQHGGGLTPSSIRTGNVSGRSLPHPRSGLKARHTRRLQKVYGITHDAFKKVWCLINVWMDSIFRELWAVPHIC